MDARDTAQYPVATCILVLRGRQFGKSDELRRCVRWLEGQGVRVKVVERLQAVQRAPAPPSGDFDDFEPVTVTQGNP